MYVNFMSLYVHSHPSANWTPTILFEAVPPSSKPGPSPVLAAVYHRPEPICPFARVPLTQVYIIGINNIKTGNYSNSKTCLPLLWPFGDDYFVTLRENSFTSHQFAIKC